MCVLFIAYRNHPRYPLIVLANRDEFYDRPTAPAMRWEDHPHVIAGRDLVGRGTWLGVTDAGKFAVVTNYRDPSRLQGAVSRGELVSKFLIGEGDPAEYVRGVKANASKYSGFNLIVGGANELHYLSNAGGEIQKLEPGVYGLSNHLLNTLWPKVSSGLAAFEKLIADDEIARDAAFKLLADETLAADADLPATGIGVERERLLSPIFIRSETYGTRSSTFVLFDNEGGITFDEKVFV